MGFLSTKLVNKQNVSLANFEADEWRNLIESDSDLNFSFSGK